MIKPSCEQIIETIQKLTLDLYEVEEERQALEVAGMYELHPWRYVLQQRQVDHLIKKRQTLQDAWNRAMNELLLCRSI
jgi:hypothetical protein